MAGQMAELLKKAFAEKGVQLPGAKVETRKVLPPGSGESSQHTGLVSATLEHHRAVHADHVGERQAVITVVAAQAALVNRRRDAAVRKELLQGAFLGALGLKQKHVETLTSVFVPETLE